MKQKINTITNNLENKKYLLVIKKSRQLIELIKIKTKINYQIFVIFPLVGIEGLSYYKPNKKQKKLTKEEKKQKILRQYKYLGRKCATKTYACPNTIICIIHMYMKKTAISISSAPYKNPRGCAFTIWITKNHYSTHSLIIIITTI